MNKKSQELLSPRELAEILKVKPSWLYRQTMQKGPDALPRYYVGKYLRFSLCEVLNWLEGRQIRGNPSSEAN